MPLEVGGETDQAVAAAHEAGDADPDADQLRGVGDLLHDTADQSGDGGAHLPRLAVAADRRLRALQHPSAQADAGHDRPVDPEVDRDDERALLGDPDPGRRAAGALARRPLDREHPLGDAERLQLVDERGDGAAVEPHEAGQLGARDLTGSVDVPQDGPEVVATRELLVGPQARTPAGGHVGPYTPAEERRRREMASTLAASRSTPPVTRKLM